MASTRLAEDHIDLDQIKKYENINSIPHAIGYVPKGSDYSGVTIATGLDLGQRNNLDEFRFRQGIIDKFKPYLGLKGEKARSKLKQSKLELTKQEVDEIDRIVFQTYFKLLETRIQRDRGDVDRMSKAAKTVLFSIQFQFGNVKNQFEGVWKSLLEGDLEAAAIILEKGDTAFKYRRGEEAKLLRNEIARRNKSQQTVQKVQYEKKNESPDRSIPRFSLSSSDPHPKQITTQKSKENLNQSSQFQQIIKKENELKQQSQTKKNMPDFFKTSFQTQSIENSFLLGLIDFQQFNADIGQLSLKMSGLIPTHDQIFGFQKKQKDKYFH